MNERQRKAWIAGCGCVFLLPLVAGLVVAAWTWFSIRSAEPRETRLEHAPTAAAENRRTTDPAPGGRLRVLLELDSCEVYVEPGDRSEPLSVEAHYDANDYRLEQTLEEGAPDTYRVRFLLTSSRLITGIKQGLRGGQPQLRIRLPRNTRIDLALVQRNGGAVIDLEGLDVADADFDVEGALLKVGAAGPLGGHPDRFAVRGRRGGIFLENLTQVRPGRIDVDFEMGQVHLDLRGEWVGDAEVGLSLALADALVRLPRRARVEGLADRIDLPSAGPESPEPRLIFTVDEGRRTKIRIFDGSPGGAGPARTLP